MASSISDLNNARLPNGERFCCIEPTVITLLTTSGVLDHHHLKHLKPPPFGFRTEYAFAVAMFTRQLFIAAAQQQQQQ